MSSTSTAQKARLFDLSVEVMDLVREGRRDPEQVARVLQGIKEDPDYLTRFLPFATPTFDIWATITIGGKSKDELLAEIEKAGMFASNGAKDIMDQEAFTTLPESTRIPLVRSKVKDLGFTRSPTTKQIFNRIREIGGELCPSEVGPHLRLHLTDQPKGDDFWLAMETSTDLDGRPSLFCVERFDDGETWLGTHCVRPDREWRLGSEIVFVLRSPR